MSVKMFSRQAKNRPPDGSLKKLSRQAELWTSVSPWSAAYPAARYLLLQRNELGGFRSTQDTVVALEALSAYAAGAYTRPLLSST